MALSIGAQLGSHEITGLLGTGGMGEVYRARDLKLKREVAIKILPEEFAGAADRLSRFQREAEVLASLNHPNIATLYGFEDSNGVCALVMELVEGPTLADRIARGPMPLEEALPIALQIIEALDFAHDRGIVHRDLKPANIKITEDLKVKLLDFGLAKALGDEHANAPSQDSPTLTMGATRAGVILGTAGYMAPEQVNGKRVDRRGDIWAFGVVLYEMLAGKPLFAGETTAEILSSVMKDRPVLEDIPDAVRPLIARCLEKDPRKRLQAIGEARIALEQRHPSAKSREHASPRPLGARIAVVIASVLGLGFAALAFVHFQETPVFRQTLRYTIALPDNSTLDDVAVAPDGHAIAFVAVANGKRELFLRPMDALQSQKIAGSDGARAPFWSPDSRYLVFVASGQLRKVAVSGGPAQVLCDVNGFRGGTWNRQDVILFAAGTPGQIWKVPAGGGIPAAVSNVPGIFPVFLPDGRHFLYTNPSQGGVYFASLDGKENRRILPQPTTVAFSPPAQNERIGYLLFVRDNSLVAQPFDPSSGRVAGDLFPFAGNVPFMRLGVSPLSVSQTGALVYQSGGVSGGNNQITWVDRAGKTLGVVGTPGGVWEPALSPDGKTIAYSRDSGTNSDIWLWDIAHGVEKRLTTSASTNNTPVWSPKGDSIVFRSNRSGVQQLYLRATSGAGQDEQLTSTSSGKFASQWSRDGRFIVLADNPATQDILILPMEVASDSRKPEKFLQSQFTETQGQISPDGHWMAFASDATGRREVYVRPFPAAEGEWIISSSGGEQPRWRADGKELFFVAPDGKMMASVVKAVGGTKHEFDWGPPVPLFDAHMAGGSGTSAFQYDVAADGRRFLIATTAFPGTTNVSALTVVYNWDSGLRK